MRIQNTNKQNIQPTAEVDTNPASSFRGILSKTTKIWTIIGWQVRGSPKWWGFILQAPWISEPDILVYSSCSCWKISPQTKVLDQHTDQVTIAISKCNTRWQRHRLIWHVWTEIQRTHRALHTDRRSSHTVGCPNLETCFFWSFNERWWWEIGQWRILTWRLASCSYKATVARKTDR